MAWLESEAAWRPLDDLVARGLKTPVFLIVAGAAGREEALATLWPELPTQRCTVGVLKNPHGRHSLLACGLGGQSNEMLGVQEARSAGVVR
jgi:hypothetical protein